MRVAIQPNNPTKQQKTKLSQALQNKRQYVYNTLVKLGCPLISIISNNFEQSLKVLVEATDSRLELIQWLVATIYPGYNLDNEYKNSYDDDPHVHKLKRLSIVLWQLGVMPMSKFTKNLDYCKYVQGLLGNQSSINLLYDLAELAEAKFSSNINKIEAVASDLLGELIKYNQELVNPNYDPYGVTFPPKFIQENEESYNKINEIYNSIFQSLTTQTPEKKQSIADQEQDQTQRTQRLFDQVDGYKQLLRHKYEKLTTSIQFTIDRYNQLVPTYDKKQVTQLHKRRVLNISKNLCKNYKNYNKLLQSIKQQQFNNPLRGLKQETVNMINSINQLNNIFV